MNATQRQSILDAIVEFEKADFNTPFQNKYKDTATIDSIVVADYSIAEIFALAKRAVSQLNDFLETGSWKIIPSDNISLPLYGTISLRNTIVNITNNLKSPSYEQAVSQIKPLVYFEMQCGFWNQPKRIELGIRESTLKGLEQRAELTMSHIDVRENKVKSLIEELETKKIEIENLIKTKRQELETLKNNQSESNTILANIINAQNNVKSGKDAIEALTVKADNIVTAIEENQERIKGQIKEYGNVIQQSKQALEDFNAEAAAKISQITSDYNCNSQDLF